jgi:hypothetical protein
LSVRPSGSPAFRSEWHGQCAGLSQNSSSEVGYTSRRNCDYLDVRRSWMARLSQLAARTCKELQGAGNNTILSNDRSKRTSLDVPDHHPLVKGHQHIFFRIAYWTFGEGHSFSSLWSIPFRRLPVGWIVAIRLGEHNRSILGYIVLPTANNDRNLIRFRERTRRSRDRVLQNRKRTGSCRCSSQDQRQLCRPNQVEIPEQSSELSPIQEKARWRAASIDRR